jgi:hypothetical protein
MDARAASLVIVLRYILCFLILANAPCGATFGSIAR